MLELLSRDILLILINYLNDAGPLFCCSKYLNNFGKKHNLRAHETCSKKLKKLSPYSSLCGSPQQLLAMVKDGLETVYTINLNFIENDTNDGSYVGGIYREYQYFIKGITLGPKKKYMMNIIIL